MFRDREIDRKCLRAGTAVILARFKRNFLALAKTNDKKAKTFGSTLIENWSRLWTFLRVENLQPTNNIAYAACGISVVMPRLEGIADV